MRRLVTLSAFALVLAVGACAEREPTGISPLELKKEAPLTTDNALVDLGRAVFFDEGLSINGKQSCASCHDPDWGWTGSSSEVNDAGAVYQGALPGRFGDRKPPSSAYATLSPVFHFDEGEGLFIGGNFWDGRATGLRLGNPAAEQALGPFLNPVEQALHVPKDVVKRVCKAYADLYYAAWEVDCDATDPEAYDNVGLAIAEFEASVESNAFTSKFDAWRHGEVELTEQEELGLELFVDEDKGKCVLCHVLEVDGEPALFTDFSFDNLGIPENPENPRYPVHDPGLGGFLQTQPEWAAMADGEMGKHKVPTLRNVDLRPDEADIKAYGHNGYFKSLWEIVHFYNSRDVKPVCAGAFTSAQAIAADCWPAPEIAENVNVDELGNLGLSYEEEMAIVAFLKTLSDGF
jgi:cytochrome c peroxidase